MLSNNGFPLVPISGLRWVSSTSMISDYATNPFLLRLTGKRSVISAFGLF